MRPPTGSVSVLRSQVVIPKECSVAELKTEIERVHRALLWVCRFRYIAIQASVRIRLKAQVYEVHGILIVHQTLD